MKLTTKPIVNCTFCGEEIKLKRIEDSSEYHSSLEKCDSCGKKSLVKVWGDSDKVEVKKFYSN